MNYLYVCNGDHIYRRKLRARGALSWQQPILPTPAKQ
jgi:hypothetical protein